MCLAMNLNVDVTNMSAPSASMFDTLKHITKNAIEIQLAIRGHGGL